ncbi:hypothetical protein [Nocardia tengchongensis]|uniref:hypothetical protein n=1 Tax=Nocardia tengchongensis TaxID=2055889 RepID=UPI003653294B
MKIWMLTEELAHNYRGHEFGMLNEDVAIGKFVELAQLRGAKTVKRDSKGHLIAYCPDSTIRLESREVIESHNLPTGTNPHTALAELLAAKPWNDLWD